MQKLAVQIKNLRFPEKLFLRPVLCRVPQRKRKKNYTDAQEKKKKYDFSSHNYILERGVDILKY